MKLIDSKTNVSGKIVELHETGRGRVWTISTFTPRRLCIALETFYSLSEARCWFEYCCE